MKQAHSQKGLSLLGWMFALVIVAFLASVAFKITPHYLDNNALEKVITAVETDPSLKIRTIPEFYSHLSKGLQINAVDLDIKEAIKITLDRSTFVVKVSYEKREPMIKNIDLVMNFDQEYRVRMQ
jgi:Tfp pilus assembly major pilin PilA